MAARILSALVVLSVIVLDGCGSSKEVENVSPEDRFRVAKQKFDSEDYLDAIEDFRIITFQFSGSSVADSAQFYLGESYFRRNRFILAASEYETLVRTMSTSQFVPGARFQIGMCYYSLSPSSELDQRNTLKALDELQSFIEYHPTNSLVPQAEEKIQELNTKLAKKDYDSGIIYMKMDNYRAAAEQFDFVLEKYHDTIYAPLALLGKVETLVARRKYPEAKVEVDRFLEKYPSNSLIDQARGLKNQIEDNLQAQGKPKAEGSLPVKKPTSNSQIK